MQDVNIPQCVKGSHSSSKFVYHQQHLLRLIIKSINHPRGKFLQMIAFQFPKTIGIGKTDRKSKCPIKLAVP